MSVTAKVCLFGNYVDLTAPRQCIQTDVKLLNQLSEAVALQFYVEAK